MNWLNPGIAAVAGCILFASCALLPARVHADEDVLMEALAGEFALQSGELVDAAIHYLNAARSTSDPALAERAAQAALLAEDDGLLEAAVLRWGELDPRAHGLLATRAMLALRRDDAGTAADALAQLFGRSEEAAIRLGLQVLSAAPDRNVASVALGGLVDDGRLPDDFQAWLALAQITQRWGDGTLTGRIVAGAVERFPDEPRAWLLEAGRLREQGRAGPARRAIERAVAADPADAGLRIAASGELERLGDEAAAAAVLAAGPQDDVLYATRASYLARAGDGAGLQGLYEEIERSLESVDANGAEVAGAGRRLLLGQIAEYFGELGSALAWYRSVPDGPVRPQAVLRMARVLADERRLDEGVELLRSLQLDDDVDGEIIRDAYVFEGELYTAAGREVEALAAYGRGLGIFEDDPVLLYARALLWATQDRIEAAEADLRRILAFDPDNAAALNALGYTLADRTDRLAEAHAHIARALELDPENPAIIDSMGWVLFRLGRIDEAIEYLERAWAASQDAEIGAHLGEALWTAGRRSEAEAVWREAAEREPGHRVLTETLERLRR